MSTSPLPSTDALPADNADALQALLRRIVPYEKAGAVIPRDLLQFGLYGSVVVIATGFLALIFPGAASIRSGSFFLLFGSTTAGLDSLLKTAAIPAIVCGIALLGLDVYLMRARTSERWRAPIVAQAAAGGVGGLLCTIFLALVILNLVLWIIIGALILFGLGALLAGAASG